MNEIVGRKYEHDILKVLIWRTAIASAVSPTCAVSECRSSTDHGLGRLFFAENVLWTTGLLFRLPFVFGHHEMFTLKKGTATQKGRSVRYNYSRGRGGGGGGGSVSRDDPGNHGYHHHHDHPHHDRKTYIFCPHLQECLLEIHERWPFMRVLAPARLHDGIAKNRETHHRRTCSNPYPVPNFP